MYYSGTKGDVLNAHVEQLDAGPQIIPTYQARSHSGSGQILAKIVKHLYPCIRTALDLKLI